MDHPTPSRMELTPLHRFVESKSNAVKPSLTSRELWDRARTAMDSLIEELKSTDPVEADERDPWMEIAELADVVTMRKTERLNKVREGSDRVAELHRRAEIAREEAEPSVPADVRDQLLKNKSQQSKDLLQHILRNSNHTKELQGKFDVIAAESEKMRERIEELEKNVEDEMSFKAYLLNIIMKVTATTISVSKDSDQVTGIIKTKWRGLVPFAIERSKLGDCDSVNYLWSLVTGDDSGESDSGSSGGELRGSQ